MSGISVPLGHRTPSPTNSAPLGLWATLGWGALAIVASMTTWLMGVIPRALGGTPIELPSGLSLLPIGHMALVAVVAVALWACRRSFREYLALEPLRWRDVGRGIGYGLLGFVAMGVVTGIITLLMLALGVAGSPPALPISESPFNGQMLPALLSFWVLMVVAAPITEELLYRGLLYRGLAASRLGAVGAIVLTSVVFGMAHATWVGWPRVVITGCVGLLLGWLRWRSGSTSICIVAHAMTNAIGAAIMTVLVLSR